MWSWLKRLFSGWGKIPVEKKPGEITDPKWLKIAYKEIGTKEIPGDKHEKRILDYHSTTTLKATEDEVPWCSAFVNWCFVQADMDGTRSAAARSWLAWGKSLSVPYRGCVVVFKRGNSNWQGHVGFYLGEQGPYILTLGGNQRDSVCIMKFSKEKLLGFRGPGSKYSH